MLARLPIAQVPASQQIPFGHAKEPVHVALQVPGVVQRSLELQARSPLQVVVHVAFASQCGPEAHVSGAEQTVVQLVVAQWMVLLHARSPMHWVEHDVEASHSIDPWHVSGSEQITLHSLPEQVIALVHARSPSHVTAHVPELLQSIVP